MKHRSKAPQTLFHALFCCKHNMVNNQYTKSVKPKHKATKLQKLTKPKMQRLQIANIEQKMQEWKMLKSLAFFNT
jgi:hypothetical protein